MYNQLFTMHGTTMIFLGVMPLSAAFFNFLVPLQVGARDVAFPRLNAFSLWTFVFGGVRAQRLVALRVRPPRRRRLVHATRRSRHLRANGQALRFTGVGIDFWIIGLPDPRHRLARRPPSTSSVTIINMRAPGMTHDAACRSSPG
jgi:cytochrome c oxidase subunit 1